MNHIELVAAVEGLLGFKVVERDNDAILQRLPDPAHGGRISVRPATREELTMYLRLLGLSARLQEATDSVEDVKNVTADAVAVGEEIALRAERAIKMMEDQLRVASLQIKDLLYANKALGEEREFLAETHSERIKSMQARHDAGLIAATERMQTEFTRMEDAWRSNYEDLQAELRNSHYKMKHAVERAESAEEMTNQMHSQLSDAEEKIRELREENANMGQVIARAENRTCDHEHEEKS